MALEHCKTCRVTYNTGSNISRHECIFEPHSCTDHPKVMALARISDEVLAWILSRSTFLLTSQEKERLRKLRTALDALKEVEGEI